MISKNPCKIPRGLPYLPICLYHTLNQSLKKINIFRQSYLWNISTGWCYYEFVTYDIFLEILDYMVNIITRQNSNRRSFSFCDVIILNLYKNVHRYIQVHEFFLLFVSNTDDKIMTSLKIMSKRQIKKEFAFYMKLAIELLHRKVKSFTCISKLPFNTLKDTFYVAASLKS